MLSFHNVKSIAVYETKTLMRSWFFRIFAILSMVAIAGFNFAFLLQLNGGAGRWAMKGLPSIIPYVSLLLLNVVQAVIAIFLASDFLKRDKKLDTTEVVYMRPMTNGEYVFGKTLGNLLVFFVLNLIILAIALIFNLLTENVSVNWISYLYYFFLISIPTLVFIMGFSFLLMSVIKNQAVTFVVLLGYVAISLFYLQDKYYYLFDYMAYNIPMTLSDFVGFGDVNKILIHRGMYFFLGVSFIHFTFILLKRLSQSKSVTYGALVVGTFFLALGGYLGYVHVSTFNQSQNLRSNMISLNDQYIDSKLVTINDYDIKLEHLGESISCEAILSVENENSTTIEKVIFSLNPGLELSTVMVNGKDQPFERKLGVVELTGMNLAAGQRASVAFTYAGTIDEAACYLDIDDETLTAAYENSLYQIDKRYAFVTSDCVLLTRETNWYPIAGAGIGVENSSWFTKQFSNYKLDVTTSPDLVAVSQGAVQGSDGHYTFTSSHAQAQISVSIAEYERIQGDIDGLEFNVFVLDGHDYFSSFFEEIQDTIPAVVTEALQDYERSLDLYYPFERFSIVEVPIQFYSYERVLSGAREQLQPEMILMAEKGLLLDDADFYGGMQRRSSGGMAGGMAGPGRPGGFGGGSSDLTPREIKIQVLTNFISSFTEAENRSGGMMPGGGGPMLTESANIYYAFPLFYNYAYYIKSDRWPVTDRVFESYKKEDDSGGGGFAAMFFGTGISEDEEANLALLSQSFEDILKDPDQLDIVSDVIQLKGEALFSIIKRKAGETEFGDFLYEYLNNNRFKSTTIDDFNDAISDRFGLDLIPYMEGWFNTTELPAFIIGEVDAVTVLDEEQEKTMVKFKVTNTERADGIISVEFRTGGGGMGGGRFGGMGGESDNVEYLVYFEGNQTKQLSFLVNGTPRGGTINTLTSRNIPSELRIMFDEDIEEDRKATPFEGEIVLDVPVSIEGENEVIIDNEDSGFFVAKSDETSLLRKLIFKEDTTGSRYKSFSQFRPPSSWTLTTNSDFFGANIRSAYYMAGGNGEQKAIWTASPLDEGSYDVYVHVYKSRMRMRGMFGGGSSGNSEYHYIVYSDSGQEEVTIDLDSAEDGWNHIGAYYFSSDTAVVEMTNESNSTVVVADAVKLIKN